MTERNHLTRGKGCCNVPNCGNNAEYINPNSSYKYCQGHYDKLGGKVILDSRSNPKIIVKLKKWVGE